MQSRLRIGMGGLRVINVPLQLREESLNDRQQGFRFGSKVQVHGLRGNPDLERDRPQGQPLVVDGRCQQLGGVDDFIAQATALTARISGARHPLSYVGHTPHIDNYLDICQHTTVYL